MTSRVQIKLTAQTAALQSEIGSRMSCFTPRFFLFCGTTFHIGYRPLSIDLGCSQYAAQLVWGLTFSVTNTGIYISDWSHPKLWSYMPTVLTKVVNSLSTLSGSSISPSDPANQAPARLLVSVSSR